MNKDQNTEQIILDAAEAEFLEKGYGNAKVVAIAKRAGVCHSMLHYYFRSKEKLFQMVFETKLHQMSDMFDDIFSKNLTFNQTIGQFIETQFNFMAKNPKLPYFILTEILTNKNNRELLFDALSAKIEIIASKLNQRLQQEIDAGRVRAINFYDLLLNIVSINVMTFVALPILSDLNVVKGGDMETILAMRRQSNVQFIINSLRV